MSKLRSTNIGPLACFVLAILFEMPGFALADETLVVKTTVAVPQANGNTAGLISFDISWVDPSLHAYFLADRSNKAVDVIDTNTKTVTHQFDPAPGFRGFTGNNDSSGPNGVLTLNNRGTMEIWAGDGPTATCNASVASTIQCSTVKVIAYPSGTLLHNIPTGGQERADELCHDPADHLIVVANDAEADVGNAPFISFIPTEGPHAYTVVKRIAFPEATNGIEQCQWNHRNGLVYLNLPEVNGSGGDTTNGSVVVIDPRRMAVVDRFSIPVSKCAGPQGMAIGPVGEILLGCNAVSQPPGSGLNSAVIEEFSGRIIRVLKDEGGADQVWFNRGNGHYYIAQGSHTPNEQLGTVDSFPFILEDPTTVIGTPGGTTRRAHSVAADENTNEVYLPIPATGGGSPGFASTVCGSMAAKGCVVVFKENHRGL